jgi:glycosyltransferase involved in cell wall biosynthesis
MKIVYVSRSVIPSRTANSIHVMRMCQAFAKAGHDVTLLAPSNLKLEEKNIEDVFDYYGTEKNFKLRKLSTPRFMKKFLYSWRCMIEIRKVVPDVVYGRNDLRTLWLSVKNGFSTVFEQHMPPEKSSEQIYVQKILAHPKGSKIVLISAALGEYYQKAFGIDPKNMLIAHDGADMVKDLGALPLDFNPSVERKSVGYVGSLFKGRGIDLILEVARRLPQYDFHLIGGNEKDIEFWKKEILLTNVIFHGFVPPKETYRYRNFCDILLAPYQTEQEGNKTSEYMSPIKLFEYMSSSKPILCSDLAVIREILNENNAYLIDPHSVDAWVEGIEKIMTNKTWADSLAQNAYRDFNDHYTWYKRGEMILEFITPHPKVPLNL